MIRGYVRLPPTDELVELWRANGENAQRVAAVLGCSPAAVGRRLSRAGVARTIPARVPRVSYRERLEALELEVARLAAELERLRLAPPVEIVRIVQWKPDHTRLADGGTPVRRQRRAIREAARGDARPTR